MQLIPVFLKAVNKEEDFRIPFLSHQQLPAGILPMVPEVAQAVGANQGLHAKDYGRTAAPNPAMTTVTAMIANELLYAGTSPTAEGILKTNNSLAHRPHGPLTRPSEQLGYLATVQGLQVLNLTVNTHLSTPVMLLNQSVPFCFFYRLNTKTFPKITRMSLCLWSTAPLSPLSSATASARTWSAAMTW